jgi:hypothetical protein
MSETRSTAWIEGHRFWCGAKDVEEDVNTVGFHGNSAGAAAGAVNNMRDANVPIATATGVDSYPNYDKARTKTTCSW